MLQYAKFLVALIGGACTAALAIFPSGSTGWTVATIASASLTAAAVYLVPNASA